MRQSDEPAGTPRHAQEGTGHDVPGAVTGPPMSKPAGRANAHRKPFSVNFTCADRKHELLADPRVFLLIEFADASVKCDVDPRLIGVALPQLGSSPQLEVWTSDTPVEAGLSGQVSYVRNDRALVGHLSIDEGEFPNLEAATRKAYESFLPLAGEMGFPHYLRIWNYIPDINGEEHGIERYKAFCVGRHAVFERYALAEQRLPAASGIGTAPGRMLIYFLAARDAGTQVENPRQVSAFCYPRQYGPKSPTFSRAMIKDWGCDKHLYISGTASIVGHESRHGDDVLPQLMESLRNMGTLVRRAETGHGVTVHSLAGLSQIKVYLRHAVDYPAVRNAIREELGDGLPVLYLLGDLCRRDLLVEVEGLYAG